MDALSPFARTRREFLTTTASGLGGMALGAALTEDGVLRAEQAIEGPHASPPSGPHFDPKAKACIFIFMAGAPSQLDLFTPKPKLNELHGQKLPQSILESARFAFIQPDSATLMGSPRRFSQHGQSGMEFSDWLPHLGSVADDLLMVRSLHSDEFNHHPGQLLMQCGVSRFGMPTTGAWLNYGLGSESKDLPGYVVLTAGRGSSGGATLYQSGFLPSSYGGVLFRNQGEPVLNLVARSEELLLQPWPTDPCPAPAAADIMARRKEMVVGIPRLLNLFYYAPFFNAYFRALGVGDVVYSDVT